MKTLRGKTAVRELHRDVRAQHPPKVELAFLLQDWDDAYNVGALFRVADGVGATEVFMSGRTPHPPDPMIAVTSLGHHRRMPWHHDARHDDAATRALAAGWTLVAVEIAEGAEVYTAFDYPDRTCLVLGNEVNGVYGGLLKRCTGAVFVPMLGKGRSLNVAVAAAVVAYRAAYR